MENLGDYGMNHVEPAHVPGCFKIFSITGVNWDEPGRMTTTGVNRGDTGCHWTGTSVAPPGLYRDKPCAMKTKF